MRCWTTFVVRVAVLKYSQFSLRVKVADDFSMIVHAFPYIMVYEVSELLISFAIAFVALICFHLGRIGAICFTKAICLFCYRLLSFAIFAMVCDKNKPPIRTLSYRGYSTQLTHRYQ